MSILNERLNELLSIYETMNELFKSELESSPQGKLIYQNNQGNNQFIQLTYDDGRRIRKGVNKDTELIKALARKEFYTKASKVLSNNIDSLKMAINRHIVFDPNQIIKSMSGAYSLLPDEYFYDYNSSINVGLDDDEIKRIERHAEWWRKPYKEYWGYPENKIKITSRGQKVRSISELLIAETLYKHSIPFHYEEELVVGGKMFAPDFTFEGYNGKLFYLD